MTLYIVRHGQTEENLQAILQGHLPGNLTEQGKEQVRKAAERLAETGVEFRCIVSSDLKRAMDSAHIIAERLHLPITPHERTARARLGHLHGHGGRGGSREVQD